MNVWAGIKGEHFEELYLQMEICPPNNINYKWMQSCFCVGKTIWQAIDSSAPNVNVFSQYDGTS